MSRAIPLSTALGEVMMPGTLITAFILAPDGTVRLDPGVLHGRSAIESAVRFVASRDQVADAQRYWVVWVAVELDGTDRPVRYRGLSVSELWIDPRHGTGYKVLAESVNRMTEAMGGGLNVRVLSGVEKTLVAAQLASLSPEVWERSPQGLKDALA